MATILLSIKPEYVAKIFDHTKRYEFRKRIPQKPIDIIVVYSSEPEQHIVGEFEVLESIPSLGDHKEGCGNNESKIPRVFS